MWEFTENLGYLRVPLKGYYKGTIRVPLKRCITHFGVLAIRILLFRVLY